MPSRRLLLVLLVVLAAVASGCGRPSGSGGLVAPPSTRLPVAELAPPAEAPLVADAEIDSDGGPVGERPIPPAPPRPSRLGDAVRETAAAVLGGVENVRRAQDAARRAAWRAEAHRRTVELHSLRPRRSVRAAVRRLWLAGAISRAAYERARRARWRASVAARRLRGGRAAEMRAAIAIEDTLARRGALTSSRLPLVVLTLERNTTQWTSRPFPAPGQRLTFGSDPLVWRYLPGQGIQVHWLASAGVVNGMAKACAWRRGDCRAAVLRRALARLVSLASRRGGFVAWESFYRWGGGSWPWISAMTQGTAIQALARGGKALGDGRWTLWARRALGAFERRPPVGVSVRAPGGRAYLMYSFAPRMLILNGFLQAVTGLHDLAVLSGSQRAERLFQRGDGAARAAIPHYDTGAWSLYDNSGVETDLNYHELTTGFLGNLCRRTGARAYCGASRRFRLYDRQPPRIAVALAAARPRPRRVVGLRFALSKVSRVVVAVSGPGRTAVLTRALYPRGGHVLAWVPPRAGRYRLSVAATGLSGHRAVATRVVSVAAPRLALIARRHRHRHP